MGRWRALAVALVLAPAGALAQPTLESLWPNHDGLRWEFEFHVTEVVSGRYFASPASLQLLGQAETPGGTAQVLIGQHEPPSGLDAAPVRDPLLRALWRARPDLRTAIATRNELASGSSWWPLLLHDGWFMKNATNIQMWQPSWTHPTWTYLTNDLSVGATFTQQLVPELADNVFLHGTVTDIDAAVSTIAGLFEHAVKMTYRIEYGWSEPLPDPVPGGMPRSLMETQGHVYYVPNVGPVDLLEEFLLLEIDCTPETCPQEWQDRVGTSLQTITLSFTGLPAQPVEPRTWTQVKNLYH